MPTGGLISGASAGLQLQPTTPGTTDTGNAHVSGKVIAESGFSTTTATNGTESFGHNVPNPATYASLQNNVFMGAQITTGGALVGTFVAMGSGLAANAQGVVVMGLGCQAGKNAIGLLAWAIGSNCTASIGSGARGLAMGYQCVADGGENIAIGKTVTANTTATGEIDVIAMGDNITAGIDAKRNLLIGEAITPPGTGLINVLAFGWYAPAVGAYPITGPGAVNNSILIGNPAQTQVKIGAYTFGAGIGLTQKIADAAYTVTSSDGTVIYTSISTARIVTLPLAAAVPAGFRILVCDASGSASGVNTITLTRAGSDTINAGTTAAIILPYGCRELISDGVSKWTIIRSI